VGKPWALQQGLEAARGDVVITLDADTRPRPGLCRAVAAALRDVDLVTAGARFVCERLGEWLLHPSMLTSIVYRFGPADADRFPPPRRTLSNGQCVAARRLELLVAGGFARARQHMTDDAALARSLARDGWRVAFVDGGRLLSVRMHASGAEVWHQWGRSIAMADVTHPADQAVNLAVVWLAMAAPLPRVLARRATPIDWLLLAVRLAMLSATTRAYERRSPVYWLSPLADVAVAVRLTLSAVRPTTTWRGRTYTAERPAARVAAERPPAPTAAAR
jgi:dolichol-phosphate mannosyltransferase